MIRRLGIGCVLLAALAMPAGAAAKNSPGEVKNAAKHCKALRAEMGVDAFRAEFGANKNRRNAFGKCVAKHARGEHRAAQKALRECKAEYLAGPGRVPREVPRARTPRRRSNAPRVSVRRRPSPRAIPPRSRARTRHGLTTHGPRPLCARDAPVRQAEAAGP